jgi:WD40 repeat protein
MIGMAVAFSPDSKWLAVGYGRYMGPPPGRLTLINIDTREKWSPVRKPDFGVTGLAFCPKGDRPLLAAAGMGGVEIWDWKTQTPAKTLASTLGRPGFQGVPGHYGSAICVAFSGVSPRTASGGWDKTIKLWEPQSGKVPQTLYGHKGYVLGVAFSPDGKRLASVGEDRVVRLWEVATGREEAVFRGHNGHVFAVTFHPDGRRVFSGGFDGLVKVWDLRRSRPVILEPQGGAVSGVAFSRDGRFVATETADGRRVWDPDTGDEIRTAVAGGPSPVFEQFSRFEEFPVTSPDSRRLARIGADEAPNDVQIVDADSGRVLFSLVGHTLTVTCVAFSADGRRIATTSHDRTVKLWDAETGQEVLTLRDHTAGVNCVAFSRDGRRLVSGSIDWTVRVWDARPPAPGGLTVDSSAP